MPKINCSDVSITVKMLKKNDSIELYTSHGCVVWHVNCISLNLLPNRKGSRPGGGRRGGLRCPSAWELGATCPMSWPLPAFIPWISKQVRGIVGTKEKTERGKAISRALRWTGSSVRKQSVKVTGSRPGSLAQVLVQPCGVRPIPGVKDGSSAPGVVSAWPSVTPPT